MLPFWACRSRRVRFSSSRTESNLRPASNSARLSPVFCAIRLAHYVFHDVHNHAGAAVVDSHVRPNDSAAVACLQRRQLAFQLHRARLHPLLQSWRQGAVALQLLFQSRRQISAALGESRRQIRVFARVVARNQFAIVRAKFVLAFLFPMAFIVITFLLMMTFSFPISLRQRRQSQRACQQTKTAKLPQSKKHFLSLSKLRAIGLTLTLAPFCRSRNSSTDTCFILVTSRIRRAFLDRATQKKPKNFDCTKSCRQTKKNRNHPSPDDDSLLTIT